MLAIFYTSVSIGFPSQRASGPLWGESKAHWCVPFTVMWSFYITIELPVIWNVMMVTSLQWYLGQYIRARNGLVISVNKCQYNMHLPILSFYITEHLLLSPLTELWAGINHKGRKMTGHTPPPAEITSWWREIPLTEFSTLLGFCVEKLLARHQQWDLQQTNYWPQSSMSVLQNHQTKKDHFHWWGIILKNDWRYLMSYHDTSKC